MRVGVLGERGTTGRLVLEELARRGHEFVPIRAEPPDVAGLVRALASVRPVALIATLRSDIVLRWVAPAAAGAGVPLVDASFDQPHLRALAAGRGVPATAADTTIVPAAGTAFLVGDLLGAVAAAAAPGTSEVHVAYSLPSRADLIGGWTSGVRRGMLADLTGGVALRGGRLVEERAGEVRRLAWFPRPVGPHHAASVPGGEALTLPRHVPGLATVRTYLAVPSMAAEMLQAAGRSLTRSEGGGWAARLLGRFPTPDDVRRRGIRWACVAEAPATVGTARAWAYGTDPYALAAAALVLVAERIVHGGSPAGVVAPGQLGDAAGLLDELTLRADARWSVSRP